jgi:DTW domain-containing protein YfiP
MYAQVGTPHFANSTKPFADPPKLAPIKEMTENAKPPVRFAAVHPDHPDFVPRCIRCLKSPELCQCATLTPQPSPVRIGILQHPHERRKAIGTARLATICLEGSFLLHGIDFSDHPGLRRELAPYAREELGILFPSADSVDLAEAPPTLKCLLAIDGTWIEARKILHNSPNLHTLPRYRFTPPRPSTYRIRKEPKPEFVSTIEAISFSLQALGAPQATCDYLLRAFDTMIDTQLTYADKNPRQMRNATLRDQREREGIVNAFRQSLSREKQRALLRGECDLFGRPLE